MPIARNGGTTFPVMRQVACDSMNQDARVIEGRLRVFHFRCSAAQEGGEGSTLEEYGEGPDQHRTRLRDTRGKQISLAVLIHNFSSPTSSRFEDAVVPNSSESQRIVTWARTWSGVRWRCGERPICPSMHPRALHPPAKHPVCADGGVSSQPPCQSSSPPAHQWELRKSSSLVWTWSPKALLSSLSRLCHTLALHASLIFRSA